MNQESHSFFIAATDQRDPTVTRNNVVTILFQNRTQHGKMPHTVCLCSTFLCCSNFGRTGSLYPDGSAHFSSGAWLVTG